jgi:3',5'-nucleoside bisphosphate phosphatase
MMAALRTLRLDLHIHTVLSPCAEVEMIPPLIVRRAHELGLDLIAITDHHAAENVEAVQRAAAGTGLAVLPGMEVQTREEAHILCLFDTLEQVLGWQEIVYASLPSARNRPEVFGPQFVVDETGEFVRENERLLLASTSLTTETVVTQVRALGGLAIASHVDRPSFSLLSNLGFVPQGLELAGLEISAHGDLQKLCGQHPGLERWTFIRSSDAHCLADLKVWTKAIVQGPTLAELDLALRGAEGRSIALVA